MNGSLLGGGSLRIGSVWGIAVKLHVVFLLWIGFRVLTAIDKRAEVIFQLVLFGSVFLHELGHCVGARYVKGEALEIILWPLGGLSRMDTPNTAKAEFLSTAAGPAVNLVLALVAWAGLLALTGGSPEQTSRWINPFAQPAGEATLLHVALRWVSTVNLALFLFNVLPSYPMDGGRLFRSMLWPLVGWRTATLVATVLAMGFGALFVVVGLQVFGDLFLTIIGALILVTSYHEFQRARAFKPLPRAWDDKMPWERDP